MNFFYVFALIFLFFALAKSADIVIKCVREIGRRLGVNLFLLGVVLGMLASLPEFGVMLGSIGGKLPTLSLGNLLGGIVILMGLLLGLGAVLNRSIATDGKLSHSVPFVLFIVAPFLFAFDGFISRGEGMLLVGLYILLLYIIYKQRREPETKEEYPAIGSGVIKYYAGGLLGMAAVVLFSEYIIKIFQKLFDAYAISPFITGLIVVAIGTNLPEIMITLRAWKSHAKELSLSNIMGSAMANIALIGIGSSIMPIAVPIDISWLLLGLCIGLLATLFVLFYRSGRALTRGEGIVLLVLYALFVVANAWWNL